MDHSSSIVQGDADYDNWYEDMLGFVIKVIDAFPIGPTLTRVGIVGFSSSAWLQFGFNAYNNSRTMRTAVENMNIGGGQTNIAQVCRPRNCHHM